MGEEDIDYKDFDSFATDITINPNFYLHIGLINAQKALMSEDIQSGMMKYIHMVNYLEMIAKSAKIINAEEYNNLLAEYKTTDEYKKLNADLQSINLCHRKIALITASLFDSGVMKETLIL